jgi:hypothetical protein
MNAPRGDLAGRLAATLNKSLKGRARHEKADPGLLALEPMSGFFYARALGPSQKE